MDDDDVTFFSQPIMQDCDCLLTNAHARADLDSISADGAEPDRNRSEHKAVPRVRRASVFTVSPPEKSSAPCRF